MGTAILSSSALASHERTALSLADNTSGLTDEIAACTEATSAVDALDPVSQCLAADSGRPALNRTDEKTKPRLRSLPRTGLVTNPAHRTIPFRFGGFVAASCIARGVEKFGDKDERLGCRKDGLCERHQLLVREKAVGWIAQHFRLRFNRKSLYEIGE